MCVCVCVYAFEGVALRYPVGFLFGLGFDTSSEIALLAMVPWGGVGCFGAPAKLAKKKN